MQPIMRKNKKLIFVLLSCFCVLAFFVTKDVYAVDTKEIQDTVNGLLNTGNDNQTINTFVLLTLLSIVPILMIMTTSFTRIVMVLSFIRNALGTQQVPPNQVIIGLALFLTFFVMKPVYTDINNEALKPYQHNEITQAQAFERAEDRMKEFMYKQTKEKDLQLFVDLSDEKKEYKSYKDVPITVITPAFVISELRTAFSIGFLIFIPFLIIDMVVSSILMSMGMFMLSPMMISLPFKLLLFVLVDGWYLIVESLVRSFN